jgi:hypothetical protein
LCWLLSFTCLLDERMLDDALTVAGVDPARAQQLLQALEAR